MDNQEPKPISEQILKRIEEERAVPRARSYFIFRNVVMWLLAGLALLLGALAASSIIFRIHNAGIVFPPRESRLEDFYDLLTLIPIIWLIVLALFGYLAYREIRKTKQGYKYELSTLLLVMIVVSGILGAMLYKLGSGYALDNFAGRHFPFHHNVEMLQRERWLDPLRGLLIGEVAEKLSGAFVLIDPRGVRWQVSYGTTTSAGEKDLIIVGARVGLLGQITNQASSTFMLHYIKPLGVRGRGMFLHRSLMMEEMF